MTHPYSRELNDLDKIEHFLSTVIKYNDPSNGKLLKKIKSGEAELKNYDTSSSTLSSTKNRDRDYVSEVKRWALRKTIVNELYSFKREDKDEDISLGSGGALPKCAIKKNNQAFIIIGLPASGKSRIASEIADEYGAVILDSDFAKRKLPEFNDNLAGASLVHDESDKLIFGYQGSDKDDDFKSLIELCYLNKNNIVIPKIGYSHNSINKLAQGIKKLGYQIHLILVSLDRRKATIRAIDRYDKTSRYVPLSLIFDGYGNDPTLTFYRLKDKINLDLEDMYIDSFSKISTDVKEGEKPVILFSDPLSPISIFK